MPREPDPERRPRTQDKEVIAKTSMVASSSLTLLKFLVGIFTGSLGLLAEAAHSLLDLVSTLITFLVIRVAAVPPDRNHPYGHERAEHLGALAGMFLLAGTGALIVYHALEKILLHPVPPAATPWSFAVLLISILVDFLRARTLRRAAVQHASDALASDAEHFANDLFGSLAVVIGLLIVAFGHLVYLPAWFIGRADAVAALVVAAIAFASVWKIGSRAVRALMDDVPPELGDRLRKRVESVDGVVPGTVTLRTRYVGRRPHVEVVVGMPRGTSLESAHQLTEKVEKTIRDELAHAEAIVHVEPAAPPDESCATTVRAIADKLGLKVHNLNIYLVARERRVELDLELSDTQTLAEAHRYSERLEAAIARELPEIGRITIHLEPRTDEPRPAVRHLPSTQRIQQALAKLPDTTGVHVEDVLVTDEGLVVTLEKEFTPGTPLAQAHDTMARLERSLRQAQPEVVRVHINPEIARDRAGSSGIERDRR
jgi:cation diffusion facilitator family transporter